jgi:hypothetical protein
MIKNLTLDSITLCAPDGSVIKEIHPEGQVARVFRQTWPAPDVDGIPSITSTTVDVTGLPQPKPGVWLLVTDSVRDALRYRTDLLSPGQPVRSDDGKLVGYTGVVRNHGNRRD